MFSNPKGMKLEIYEKKSWKVYKYIDTKQDTLKQPMGKLRIHKVNLKILGDKWNKHTMPNLWDTAKAV